MAATSHVIARDPVDVTGLFEAARMAAGGAPRWTLFDGPGFEKVCMLRTDNDQGAAAIAAVHYPRRGGPYPREDHAPDGYARVMFTSDFGADEAADRQLHVRLAAAVVRWLGERGLRWWWQYGEEDWQAGQPS
jgi:hypothetical protein